MKNYRVRYTVYGFTDKVDGEYQRIDMMQSYTNRDRAVEKKKEYERENPESKAEIYTCR
jgi:hypothetical protein